MKTIKEQADELIEEHYKAFWLGDDDRVANVNAVEMIRAAIITIEKQIEITNGCEIVYPDLKGILEELKNRLK